MIRSLARALDPAVEALLRRLERGVEPRVQRRLAQRLRDDLRAPPPATAPPDAEALVRDATEETSPGGRLLAQAVLVRGALRAEPLAREVLEVALQRSVAGPGPDGAGVPLHAASLLALAGLRSGALPPAGAAGVLDALTAGLEPARWFRRVGTPYGRANLLRALLHHPGDAGRERYVLEVCERMLRHVEVRRAEALCLAASQRRPPWRESTERLRFALAFLDAAERFGDLRLLNAALKLIEWQHGRARRAGRTRDPGGRLLGHHYAAAVDRQEALLGSLVP